MLNNVEYTYDDPVTMKGFNIRFQTHTPQINGVEGFIVWNNYQSLDDEAYFEFLDKNGGELTEEMDLKWDW